MRRPKLIEVIFRNLVTKPSTVQYPREKTEVEPDSRGIQYADLSKCTGCSLCSIECPADAIKMTLIPQEYEVPKTNPRRLFPLINYGKCVYCYRCVKICPVNAYIVTNKYDIASSTRCTSENLSLATLKKVVSS
ncbi:MAG: 4Fe-4S binding protein [Desulfurococcaceae archaeon]